MCLRTLNLRTLCVHLCVGLCVLDCHFDGYLTCDCASAPRSCPLYTHTQTHTNIYKRIHHIGSCVVRVRVVVAFFFVCLHRQPTFECIDFHIHTNTGTIRNNIDAAECGLLGLCQCGNILGFPSCVCVVRAFQNKYAMV